MAARPDLRIGDADREAAAASLREHFAQGRLSLTEFNDRIDAAFAATTQGDLDDVTRDLPHVRVPSTPLPEAGVRPIGTGGSGDGRHGGARGARGGASARLGIMVSLVSVMAMWFVLLASMLLLRFPFAGKFSVLFGVFVIVRSVFRRFFGGRGAGRGGGRRYHYHGR
jgi:Domain of unknown function (DUF1707)